MKRVLKKTAAMLGIVLMSFFGMVTMAASQIIRTPNGSVVSDSGSPAETLSPDDIAEYNEYVETTYPLATRLSDATSTYNCHGYTWHMSEGGFTAWIGLTTTTAEDIYWQDGSYSGTSATSATKVSYSGNHSAITTSSTLIFRSKWGSLPLMEHGYLYRPSGYGSPTAYYARTQTPPPPTNFTITNAGQDGAHPHLTWNASPTATSYKVYRCYDNPGNQINECDNSANWSYLLTTTNTYADDNSVTMQNYCYQGGSFWYIARYRVTAVWVGLESDPSNQYGTCTNQAAKISAPLAEAAQELPKNYSLEGSYPNPFNPSTQIRFALPEGSHVDLRVYNVQGQQVAQLVDSYLDGGYHQVTWNAENFPNGLYLYRLMAKDFVATKAMTLIK